MSSVISRSGYEVSGSLVTARIGVAPRAAAGPMFPRGVVVLFVIDGAIAVASLINFLVAGALGIEPPTFLRLGQESNLPTWYASTQHAAVAALFALLAWRDLQTSWRGLPLLGLAGIFAFFSLDETGMIHERIGAFVAARTNLNDQHGLATGPAMIVCLPLALAAVALACGATRPYWRGRPGVTGMFVAGMAVFLFSAGVMELLVDFVAANVILVKLETLVEETGEMLGTTLMLAAAVRLLAAEKFTFRFGGSEAQSASVTLDGRQR